MSQQMHVAWVRVNYKWVIVGKSLLRQYAQDQACNYPVKKDRDHPGPSRVVLPDGEHPYGPTTIDDDDSIAKFLDAWDCHVWPKNSRGPF